MNDALPPESESEASLDDFLYSIAESLTLQLHQVDLERIEQVTGISSRSPQSKTQAEALSRPTSPKSKSKSKKSTFSESVKQYLNEISKYGLLSAAEEVELARAMEAGVLAREVLARSEDLESSLIEELMSVANIGRKAKEMMVQSNLRLVFSLAKRTTSTSSFDLLDAIQEGNIGLFRATEMFDFKQGYKFSTYATWWIRASLSRSFADQARIIRLPVHVVDDLAKIRRAQRLLFESGLEVTIEGIAARAELTVTKTLKLLRASLDVVSINAPLESLPEGFLEDVGLVPADWPRKFTLSNVLIDDEDLDVSDLATKNQLLGEIEYLLDSMSEREAGIVRMRWGLMDGIPRTLDQIGDTYGVTRERIRQIESKAMAKFRHPVMMQSLQGFLT